VRAGQPGHVVDLNEVEDRSLGLKGTNLLDAELTRPIVALQCLEPLNGHPGRSRAELKQE
jgi:hypothetical protein